MLDAFSVYGRVRARARADRVTKFRLEHFRGARGRAVGTQIRLRYTLRIHNLPTPPSADRELFNNAAIRLMNCDGHSQVINTRAPITRYSVDTDCRLKC